MHAEPELLLAGLIGFVLVGIALGLLGGGGSILAVPMLIHILGVPAGVAVPMSLPIVGLTALVGAIMRWGSGDVRPRTALTFALIAMTSAYLTARIGSDIPDRTRILLFVTVMLTAAGFLWYRSRQLPPAAPGRIPPLFLVIAAVGVGIVTGITGVGGGFLVVPVLTGVLGLSMAQATATSLLVIAGNTAAAGIGWWGQVSLDLPLTAAVTGAALVGMVIGTRLAPRFSTRTLTRVFAGLLLTLSLVMLWQEFSSSIR